MDDVSTTTTSASPPDGVTRRNFLHWLHLWTGCDHCSGPGIAGSHLYLLFRQVRPERPMGRNRPRSLRLAANSPTEMTFRPQPCGRLESHQRKGDGLGGEAMPTIP